jgi:hypothetical protein
MKCYVALRDAATLWKGNLNSKFNSITLAELPAARRSGDVARIERASKALLEFVDQRCSSKA